MIRNHVRSNLSSGKPAMGPFIGLQSPNVAELMGNAGFDFVVDGFVEPISKALPR